MKKAVIILMLTVISIFANAQKISMVFSASGIPIELTLVDSNGVRIGYSNFYNETGTLVMSLMYKNGVPNGQWARYDNKTGKLKETFVYVNGKLNGVHCWYDESGKIIKDIAYNNGVRVNNTQTENQLALQSSTSNNTTTGVPSGF